MFSQIVHTVWKRLAMLGLIVTEEAEPRVADAKRNWGTPNEGLVLSLAAVVPDDRGFPPDLSLALKNLSEAKRTLTIPDWMAFYKVVIDAPLTEYGKLMVQSAETKPRQQITIAAGKFVEADIPMDRLYELQRDRPYNVAVECPLGLKSNSVEVIL